MKHRWNRAALVALTVAGLLAALASVAGAAPKKPASERATRVALHQFSGVVTAIDASSLTVEKQGRSPRTMQFVRDAKMTTRGEVEKQSHVTVYYRDDGGKATAHRVVVRGASGQAP
jgi:hypothetical protein